MREGVGVCCAGCVLCCVVREREGLIKPNQNKQQRTKRRDLHNQPQHVNLIVTVQVLSCTCWWCCLFVFFFLQPKAHFVRQVCWAFSLPLARSQKTKASECLCGVCVCWRWDKRAAVLIGTAEQRDGVWESTKEMEMAGHFNDLGMSNICRIFEGICYCPKKRRCESGTKSKEEATKGNSGAQTKENREQQGTNSKHTTHNTQQCVQRLWDAWV